jgi:hypothetical protein
MYKFYENFIIINDIFQELEVVNDFDYLIYTIQQNNNSAYYLYININCNSNFLLVCQGICLVFINIIHFWIDLILFFFFYTEISQYDGIFTFIINMNYILFSLFNYIMYLSVYYGCYNKIYFLLLILLVLNLFFLHFFLKFFKVLFHKIKIYKTIKHILNFLNCFKKNSVNNINYNFIIKNITINIIYLYLLIKRTLHTIQNFIIEIYCYKFTWIIKKIGSRFDLFFDNEPKLKFHSKTFQAKPILIKEIFNYN